MTGTFTTDSNGNANVLLTSASIVNDIKNVKLKLNTILPEVSTGFSISSTPILPIELTTKNSSGTTLSTSVVATIGDKVTFNIVNGPSNGNYYAVNNYGERIPTTGTLPLNPSGTLTTLDFETKRVGFYNWTFYFSDNRQAPTGFMSAQKAAVYAVNGPSNINMKDVIKYVITSTNVGSTVNIPFTITNNDGMWLTKDASSSTLTVMNVSGGYNYTAYVNSYADIKALYNDGVNGTGSYASNSFPGVTKIYATLALETTAYFANAPFVTYAKQGIDAFGKWHWENYGRAENRTIPQLNTITGTITVSDTTPATIGIYVNPLNGFNASSAQITLNLDAPIGQNKTTTINSTAGAVSVPTGSALSKPKVGDFIDSSMTIRECIEARTYVIGSSPGDPAAKTYNQIIGDPNSKNKMWIFENMKQASINVHGPNVKNYYVTKCNRNPDVEGFIYWLNRFWAYQAGTDFTSPAVYPISGGASFAYGSGVAGQFAVWVAPEGGDNFSGQTKTIWRYFYTTVSGTHNLYIGADDEVTVIVDGQTVGTYKNSEHWKIPAWPNNDGAFYITIPLNFLSPGKHTIKVEVKNMAGETSYAKNPGWYAWAITDPAGTLVATSRTDLGATTMLSLGTALTEAQATTQVMNDFDAAAKANKDTLADRTSFLACTTDPLAQTFFVSAGIYPNGVFLTGISLYFESVDESLPVFVQIRPTVNGYPSSNKVIPLSTVWKNPYEINTSTDSSVETLFRFTDPIYLQAGEYAIVVGANSSKTKAFYATVGQKQIGSTNTISQQPNVGSLFMSQNGSTWTADQSSDLSFKLYYAQFDTTKSYDAVFKSSAPATAFDFEVVDVMSQELDFNNTTDINYSMINQYDGTSDSSYTPILANKNTILKTYKNNTAFGDTIVKATLSTLDKNVSPVIDLDRMSMIMINNIINDRVDVTIPETTASGGNASAKYVTRAITLASGFDAKGVKVTFDANMQSGTSFDVFVKVLAADDVGAFGTKPWIQVPNVDSVTKNSSSYTDFIEQNYFLDNISYISNGIIHNSFQTFAVKVVMYSGTPAIIPQIKNFRAIATS